MTWLKFSGAVAIKIASGLVMLALTGLAACTLWFMAAGYHLVSIDQDPLTNYGSTSDAVIVTAAGPQLHPGDTVGYAPGDSKELAYATVHSVHDSSQGQSEVIQLAPEITGAPDELITPSQVVHTVATGAPIFESTVPGAGTALNHPGIFWTLVAIVGAASTVGIIVPARKHLSASQPAEHEFDAYEIVEQLFPGVLINEFASTWSRTTREFEPFQP